MPLARVIAEAPMLDSIGIMGNVLHHGMVVAFVGSAFLVFVYLWRRGRLDMDEAPSEQMMKLDDVRSEWRKPDDNE